MTKEQIITLMTITSIGMGGSYQEEYRDGYAHFKVSFRNLDLRDEFIKIIKEESGKLPYILLTDFGGWRYCYYFFNTI
jgi:hypothetical protein